MEGLQDGPTLLACFALLIALTVVLGGLIILGKQKIVVNDEGQVTSVDVPFLGKVRTNYPSVVAIFFGILLAAFVLQQIPFHPVTERQMPLKAVIQLVDYSTHPSSKDVFLGVIPLKYHKMKNQVKPNTTEEIQLKVAQADDYHAVAYAVTKLLGNGDTEHVVDHGSVTIHEHRDGGKVGKFVATLRVP